MLNQERVAELEKRFANDKEVKAMILNRDIQGLIAKCAEAGYEVSEAKMVEYVIGNTELSLEELNAVSGGCGGPYGCGDASCHSDK